MRYKSLMFPALVLATAIGVAAVRTGSSSEAAAGVDGDPLSEQTRSALADRGLTYEVEGIAASDDAEKSTASVIGEFDGFLDMSSTRVARVTFSDTSVGVVSKSSGEVINPKYMNRDAFMVVFDDQGVPMFGSMLGKGAAPETVHSTFVAFVDPESFDVITAIAYAPGELQVEPSSSTRR